MVEYLNESIDHHVLSKMQVLNVLPANAQHFRRKSIVELLLGLWVSLDRFLDQLLFVAM